MAMENNIIIIILMFFSTCSQNLIDAIKETSLENNIKKEQVAIEKEIDRVIAKMAVSLDSASYLLARPTPKEERDDVFDDEDIINNIEKEEIVTPKPSAKPPLPSVVITSDEEFADAADYEEFNSGLEAFGDWEPPHSRDEDNLEFIDFDKPPQPKPGKGIKPTYPRLALEMKLEGKVWIKFYIDKKGRVNPDSVKMVRGNPVFEKVAIDAIIQSEWEPAMLRDKKIEMWMTLPVNFSLE